MINYPRMECRSRRPSPAPWRTALAFLALLSAAAAAPAEDVRAEPIDAFLLLDASAPMAGSSADAAEWLCSSLVDGILRDGDRVVVWAYAAEPARVAALTLDGDKDALKAAIRTVRPGGGEPDIAAALRAAALEEAARPDRTRTAFVLLVGSFQDGDGKAAGLERSRVDDHPGWKSAVVGIGIDERVRAAAEAYFAALLEDGARGGRPER